MLSEVDVGNNCTWFTIDMSQNHKRQNIVICSEISGKTTICQSLSMLYTGDAHSVIRES